MTERNDFEDDGITVADMSDIRPQPLLFPDLGLLMGQRGGDKSKAVPETPNSGEPMQLDRGERRALIRGTITAYLAALAVFAAVFVIAILLLVRFGR